MERATALDAVDLESSRFLVAASNRAGSLDAPVPSCPGWDVAHLVKHLGVIYSRLALVVPAHRTEVPDRSELPPVPDGEDAALLVRGAADGDARCPGER